MKKHDKHRPFLSTREGCVVFSFVLIFLGGRGEVRVVLAVTPSRFVLLSPQRDRRCVCAAVLCYFGRTRREFLADVLERGENVRSRFRARLIRACIDAAYVLCHFLAIYCAHFAFILICFHERERADVLQVSPSWWPLSPECILRRCPRSPSPNT